MDVSFSREPHSLLVPLELRVFKLPFFSSGQRPSFPLVIPGVCHQSPRRRVSGCSLLIPKLFPSFTINCLHPPRSPLSPFGTPTESFPHNKALWGSTVLFLSWPNPPESSPCGLLPDGTSQNTDPSVPRVDGPLGGVESQWGPPQPTRYSFLQLHELRLSLISPVHFFPPFGMLLPVFTLRPFPILLNPFFQSLFPPQATSGLFS